MDQNDDTKNKINNKNSVKNTDSANIVLNLESLIKSHITSIDRIKEEIKTNKEMLDSVLENDSVYKDHSEKAKEANKIKATTKQQILKQPQASNVYNKLKDQRQELKDLQTSLSDYLREFQRLSGSNEIEGEDGEVREIVYVAKLVKKSPKKF